MTKELNEDDFISKTNNNVNNNEPPEYFINQGTIKAYRMMELIDGKLYPPMAGKIEGKLVSPVEIGKWEKSIENPNLTVEKIDKNTNKKSYYFNLVKAGKDAKNKKVGDVLARYNPYFHSSLSPLNDQFETAYKRPNLVTVEVEIPIYEIISSKYKAYKAKDSVGEKKWRNGPVSSKLAKLGKPRKVYLTQYCKINRIVHDSEVAQKIKEQLEGTNIKIEDKYVTPNLAKELEKINVPLKYTKDVKEYYSDVKENKNEIKDYARNNFEYFDKEDNMIEDDFMVFEENTSGKILVVQQTNNQYQFNTYLFDKDKEFINFKNISTLFDKTVTDNEFSNACDSAMEFYGINKLDVYILELSDILPELKKIISNTEKANVKDNMENTESNTLTISNSNKNSVNIENYKNKTIELLSQNPETNTAALTLIIKEETKDMSFEEKVSTYNQIIKDLKREINNLEKNNNQQITNQNFKGKGRK